MDSPPPTFKCGHQRSPENTVKNGPGTRCRTCKNARSAARRAANPEAHRERLREYYTRKHGGTLLGHANTRKTHCPQGHPYSAANTYVTPAGVRQCKTCRREQMRQNYAKNREKRRARLAERYASDPEFFLSRNRAWAKANPDKANLNNRLKKQRRRAAGVLTSADWQQVLDTYGAACLACGSDEPPTIDHVVPVSRGGTNTVENVQPLCMDCNTRKGTKTIDYRPGAAVV